MRGRTSDEWIRQYSESHQHPINRACHTVGIPMIAISIPLAIAGFWWRELAVAAAALFVVGWVFQFVGHAVEGKPPEFFRDWRFLFVGLRWWVAKMAGRA
jgi:uncharacterized membrane protein YGL010W